MLAKREFGELELTILKTFEGQHKLTVKEVVAFLGGRAKGEIAHLLHPVPEASF